MTHDQRGVHQRLTVLLVRAHRTGLSPEAAKLIGAMPSVQQAAWADLFALTYRSGGVELSLEEFSAWVDSCERDLDDTARGTP